jgi:phospholipid-binding lipoprotein MlaA
VRALGDDVNRKILLSSLAAAALLMTIASLATADGQAGTATDASDLETPLEQQPAPTVDGAVDDQAAATDLQSQPTGNPEPQSNTAELLFADDSDPLFDDDYELESETGFPDPLEEPNRLVLKFNQGLDKVLLAPITKAFSFITPTPIKLGLRNFFANLNTPVVLINDMLQLEWKDAAVCTGAFVVNTTIGVAGFIDIGERVGLPRHSSDFGQTLALARVPSGPYLMIPIAGPSTARGTVGSVVDFFMRPNTWILPLTNFYYYGGEGVVTLEEHGEKMRELERSSVDYYSVLRSAYTQTREDQIWGRRADRRSN